MDNREELKRSLAEEEQRAKDSLANVEKMKKQLEELDKKEEQPIVSATGVILNSYILENRTGKFYITAGRVLENFSDMGDKGVYFTNEEQAKQEALRIEGQEFIRRCAMLWNKDYDWRKDLAKNQYNIFYGMFSGLIIGDYNYIGDSCPYFDTRELAEKCIKELKEKYNEDQIKTIFGVK